jgi:hypothetical protein
MSFRTITVKTSGKNPSTFIREVDARVHFEFQEKLFLHARECAERMQDLLNRSGFNLTDLASKIRVDILGMVGGLDIGIGKVEDLPRYWEWFNAGFQPKSTGTFVPMGAFPNGAPDSKQAGGKWGVGKGKYTFIDNGKAKKPVLPIMYIDISAQELEDKIAQDIDELSKGLYY